MLARAFSKPSLARSERFFMASCWPALATTSFIVSWRISACRRTRRCQPSKAILFALARASMFFRSRSTSAAKSTPGSRNWLISLVKSKTGVSAPFSVGLMSLDTVVFLVGLLLLDTAPFSVGLRSLETAPFFVGLLSLDMMFSLGLVECPRELVAASPCGLMQINHQPLIGRNVQRRNVRFFEEMSDGRCWSGLDRSHHHRRDCRLAGR